MKKGIIVILAVLVLFIMGNRYGPEYLDNMATKGLTGTVDSIAYRIEAIEAHFHSRARWFGIAASPTATDKAADRLTPFVAISGDGAYGTDTDDQADVFGTADTPIIAGMLYYDFHEILVVDVDHGTPYKLRICYGTGTQAEAVTAKQYTEVMLNFDATNPQLSAGIPVHINMLRLAVDTKIWIDAWNVTNNSEIDFYVGIHEYEG